jgi:hypothetical protein
MNGRDMSHIDFARMRDGKLSFDELRAASAHLRSCPQCLEESQRAFEGPARALEDAFAAGVPEEASPPNWLPRVAVLLAAAAVIAVAMFLALRPAPPRPAIAPRIETSTVTPAVAPPMLRKPEWQSLVDTAVRTGHLPMDKTIALFTASDVYRGGETDEGAAVHPSGTAVVERDPLFTWPAAASGPYEVEIFREDGEPVASSGPLKRASWRSPALARGVLYRWQVRAGATILPAPPAPPAVFRVISTAQAAELAEASRTRPDDHLLLGLLHARAGVVDQARLQLDQAGEEGRRLSKQLPR